MHDYSLPVKQQKFPKVQYHTSFMRKYADFRKPDRKPFLYKTA